MTEQQIAAMRQLIEDLISAMEYHVEQTRPVHMTTIAIQAGKDALKTLEQQPAAKVSPLEFVTMVLEKEHLVGKPLIWAEWPNAEGKA